MKLQLLDASVLLASEDADDPNHAAARRLLEGAAPLATLDLAFYEVANVAVRSWHDQEAAGRLQARVAAIAEDGGVVRADLKLISDAAALAAQAGISVYDAAYVAAAQAAGAELVSCDVPDLVSRGLAKLPPTSLNP
ncbi:MAG: PIN domain-containing protein [Bifidobacteriaceae bacterium]|nr:PIN domain-containing protein [Bifidobacteriaceae bacterium]